MLKNVIKPETVVVSDQSDPSLQFDTVPREVRVSLPGSGLPNWATGVPKSKGGVFGCFGHLLKLRNTSRLISESHVYTQAW